MKIRYEEQFKSALREISLYIAKDKPTVALNFKRELKTKIDIDSLPSSVDKYIGIVNENEVDLDYKSSKYRGL